MQAQNIAKASILTGLAMLTVTCNVALSATRSRTVNVATSASKSSDESILRSKISTLREHATKQDAKAMSNLWTVDGIYIDETGNKVVGRGAVEKFFAEAFVPAQKNSPQPLEIAVESVRFPAGSVALVDGTVNKKGAVGFVPTRYSMTFLKQKGGDWLISSASETLMVDQNVVSNPLEKLNWLIGDWSASGDGKSLSMKADWLPAKNFIKCVYEIKVGNDVKVESQVIGWDPRTKAPRSWNFDADGGFGTGAWTHRNNQWLVSASGVDRDGSTSTATNVFSSSAPNEFSWQSVNRHLDGVPIADTAIVKVHRVK